MTLTPEQAIAELEEAHQLYSFHNYGFHEIANLIRSQQAAIAELSKREVACVWCGFKFESTIQSQAEHLYEHAKICEKHPIRKLEAAIAKKDEALRTIAEGKGAFRHDPLEHAENVINEAIATAKAALEVSTTNTK